MAINIPLFQDPFFEQTIALDDRSYRLVFEWNVREGSWRTDIQEQDGTPILTGLKLLPFVNLTQRFTDPRLPSGSLFVYDKSLTGLPPGRDDLANRIELWYLTEEDELAFIPS